MIPDPCEEVECPEYGVCKDLSNEEEPKTECTCTMGYNMNAEGTNCISMYDVYVNHKAIDVIIFCNLSLLCSVD